MVAIRDNPWFADDVRACVEVEGGESERCWGLRDELLGENPLPEAFEDELFTAVDLTEAFCDDEYCYPVIGNVLAYLDSNHVTGTYQRTMGPLMARSFADVDWW